ncbi:MAG: hypothetical protein M1814_002394 [Vezdaea aestivalis]|nr:MAG: hypothetical protein M1814_002394 [Vezdaea aestivalis]
MQAHDIFLSSAIRGDESSTSRIIAGLDRLGRLFPPQQPRRRKIAKNNRDHPPEQTPDAVARGPGTGEDTWLPYYLRHPIFQRPYQTISGRRHVPILVSANQFPMLRIKKPQPPALTAAIVRARRRLERHVSMGQSLEILYERSCEEDDWEYRLIQMGLEGNIKESSYSDSVRVAQADLTTIMRYDRTKKITIAKRFTEIVDQERALYLKERDERKRQRMQERWEKWQQRQANPLDGGDILEQSDADHKEPLSPEQIKQRDLSSRQKRVMKRRRGGIGRHFKRRI